MNAGNPLSVILVVAVLAGCATVDAEWKGTSASRTREAFGEAVREARMRQTLDPDAGRRQLPQPGIDASAAVSAWRRYQDSFREPPPAFEVLGIGGLAR